MSVRFVACLIVLCAIGCDDKKPTAAAPSATPSATAPAPSAASAAPAESASAASASGSPSASASASAAPASSAAMITGDGKDVVLTVKDPTLKPDQTIKVPAGGSLTLFLPDAGGNAWSLEGNDKTLGKAKEEVIPGFAPKTLGHQFKWEGLKAGVKHKLQFGNRKAGDKDKAGKPNSTFSLTVETT
jgi:hypothetical protein